MEVILNSNILIKKYDYNTLKNDLMKIKNEYSFLQTEIIGESTLKEKIICIKIGEGKRKLMINASHHANEWITSLVVMLFLEKYLYCYKNKIKYKNYDIQKLWKKATIYIVPMVNPDGVNFSLGKLKNKYYLEKWKEYSNILDRWKANINGVDLNLNYPAGWEIAVSNKKKLGIYNAGLRDYPGNKSLSEIETINMVNLTRKYLFDMTISLHSQGREIYGPNKKENKKAYEIGKKFEKNTGYYYTSPSYMSSFAGYKDWFIQEYSKPAYTIELGKGEEGKALSENQAQTILQEMEKIFLISIENI